MKEAGSKFGVKGQDFRLWAEVATGPEAAKINWLENYQWNSDSQTVIFLKYFDVENQTLEGLNHVYMRKNDKVSDLAAVITNEMNWPPTTAVKLYEVCPTHQ